LKANLFTVNIFTPDAGEQAKVSPSWFWITVNVPLFSLVHFLPHPVPKQISKTATAGKNMR
jgi:hypothetical protein